MWSYTITDESGKEYILTFDHEPTQAEIEARIEAEIWSSGKGTIAQGLEKIPAFATGLAKGTVSAGADIYSLLGATGKKLGLDSAGQWFDEGADAAAGWERGMDKYVRETMPDAKGTYGIGSMTAQVLPMIVPAWGASKVAPAVKWLAPAATATAAGTQGSAGYLRQARAFHEAQMAEDDFREKYPDVTEEDIEMMAIGRAAPWAILSGVKTAALTALGGHLGGKYLGSAGPEAIAGRSATLGTAQQFASRGAQHFGQTGWQGLGRASAIGGVESVEETIDEAVQVAIDKYTIDENMGWGDIKERLLTAAGAGFVFGASMHGAARYDWKVAQKEFDISQKEADEAWSEKSKADLLGKVENSLGKNLARRLSQQYEIEQGTAARARTEFFQGPDSPLTQEQKSALAKSERGEPIDLMEARAVKQANRIIEITEVDSELGMPLTVTEQQAASRMDRSADQIQKVQAIQNLELALETAPPESAGEIKARIAQLKSAAEPVPDAAVQKLLDEMGVTSVKEAYDMIVAGETPAPIKFVEEAVADLEAEQDGQQEAVTEMEKAAAEQQLELEDSSSRLAKSRERLLAPSVGREFQKPESLPTSYNSMLGLRKAERAGKPATSPDFTGPTAAVEGGPTVARPDAPNLEADLGFLGKLNESQKAVLEKVANDKILTKREIKIRDEALRILEESKPQPQSQSTKEMGGSVLKGPLTRAEKKLLERGEKGKLKRGEHWSLKRLKKRLERIARTRKEQQEGRGYKYLASGMTTEGVIDAGIDAALVAVNAGMKIDEALEAAVKAMEKAGFNTSKVSHNDLKREIAGKLSDRLSEIEGRNKGYHYGDTGTAGDTKLDRMSGGRGTGHFGTGTYFLGTPERGGARTKRPLREIDLRDLNLLTVTDAETGFRVHDLLKEFNSYALAPPARLASEETMGKYEALRLSLDTTGQGKVPSLPEATDFIQDAMFNVTEMFRDGKNDGIRTPSTYLMQELGFDGIDTRGVRELDNTQYGSVVYEKPFKASREKLKKIRDSLRKYRKGGRTNMGGLDIGGAAVLDAAFTVTLKAMEAGDTLTVAMQKGYDSLGSTEISKARFENYMGGRMLFAVDELDKGVSLEDAIKSSGLPLEGKSTIEVLDTMAEVEAGKKDGIPPPTTEIADLGNWWDRIKGAFWGKGTADVMKEGENSAAFMGLGDRMNDHVSQSGNYAGKLQAMLLDTEASYTEAGNWFYDAFGQETKEQKQATKEFEEYQKSLFANKTPPDITGYSKLGQTIIKGWQNVAEYTGDVMEKAGLKVQPVGEKPRDFKKLGKHFWMRAYKQKYTSELNRLKRGDKMSDYKHLEELGDILLKHKEIKSVTVDNIFNWYNRGRATKRSTKFFTGYEEQNAFFDFLGRAREKGDPILELQDFSFDAAKRYVYNWSERMAQIDSYGQKLRDGSDLFERAIAQFRRDNNTEAEQLVKDMRKAAYQQESGDRYWEQKILYANKVATLLMLTGGFNAIRNLTGAGVTTTVYGVQNSLKAFKQMREYAEAAKQSRAWGVLRNDMALLMSGQDSEGTNFIDDATRAGLKLSGFSGAENFVRIHAALTASVFAAEGVGAVKGGKTKLANEFKRMAERLEVDWEAIVKEDGSKGAVTQDFIRRAVMEVQGGYRFNQLPAFMSNPIGKFMFKFGAYAMQVGRAMRRNVWGELTHGNVAPLLRALAMVTGSGEMLYELRRLLFGSEKPHASLAEIMRSDSKFKLAFKRLVNDITYAGTLGYVSDVLALGKDVATQQRVKNPFDPAGMETPNQILRFLTMPLYTKEPYTIDDTKKFLRSISATVRYGEKFAKEHAGKLGIEWDAAELQRAKDDRNALRFATRRFQESVGGDVKNLTSQPDYREGEFTAELRDIKNALMIGDVLDAQKAAVVFAQDLPLEKREKAWSRISQSIQASQPMKIGDSYSREIKDEFIEWARRNLDEEQFMQVMAVQDRYMGAAANAGLIGAAEDSLEREMKTILNLKAPASRGRRGTGREITTEELLDSRIRSSRSRRNSVGREITTEELLEQR